MHFEIIHVLLGAGLLHLASAKPITSDSTCISPGLSCDTLEDSCCAGYSCTPTSEAKTAYCVINPVRKVPFIMPMPGPVTNAQFMARHHTGAVEKDGRTECVVLGGLCDPDSGANMGCCLDSTCQQFEGMHYCVEEPRPNHFRREVETKCGNPDVCSMDEHCCEGNTCQRVLGNAWLGTCVPIDAEPQKIPCYTYMDCPNTFRCSHTDPTSWEGYCTAPEHHEGRYINRRGELEEDTGVMEEEKKPRTKFPTLPATDCREPGCPCYYSSPCTNGICDNYDQRMIGRCREFSPGEGDDLQPGFPIDTIYCTKPGCPCNKWYDHCWVGACDNLNKAGYGRCRAFRPYEEPRMHRTISYDCTAVGCVCDGPGWPCEESRCVIKGGNKYGRCRRFDNSGRMIYTRDEKTALTGAAEFISDEFGSNISGIGGMEDVFQGDMAYNTEYYETHDTWERYPAQMRERMRGQVANADGAEHHDH